MDVKSVLFVGVVILFSACSEDVGSDSTAQEIDGESLYENNCASCHGLDGKAGVTGAKDLAATKLDSSNVYRVLVDGQGVMPPFEYIITSEEERNAVVDHVISLKE